MKFNLLSIDKRFIGSLFIIPIILSLVFGGVLLKLIIFLITAISLIEFSNAMNNKKIFINKYLLIFFAIIYYAIDFVYIDSLIFLFFILLLFSSLNRNNNIIDISLTFISVFYIIIPFSFIIFLKEKSIYWVWIIFLSAWSIDTTAYFVGKKFGKHKLCKNISPNKTIEGFIGGILGCVLVIFVYGICVKNNFGISNISLFFISILTGIIGQIGDLIASSIKRFTNIKDFGNLIPGHGGMLDRFDSVLMISIVVFLCSQILL